MERVFKALSFPSSEEIRPVRLVLPVHERKHVDNTEKQSLVQSPHNENILDKNTNATVQHGTAEQISHKHLCEKHTYLSVV